MRVKVSTLVIGAGVYGAGVFGTLAYFGDNNDGKTKSKRVDGQLTSMDWRARELAYGLHEKDRKEAFDAGAGSYDRCVRWWTLILVLYALTCSTFSSHVYQRSR